MLILVRHNETVEMNLSELREEYSRQSLDEANVAPDPFVQFEKWFGEALDAKAREANAMNLSTVSADGQPHGRIVLLKGLENNSFVFFTNYKSKKGEELEKNRKAALTFFWAELERQVRIEGVVEKVDPATSDEYFHLRPTGSQIGAWASNQSEEIENRKVLEAKTEEYTAKFSGINPIPRPAHWGGYRLQPHMIEFWQGRPSRLHDRIVYEYDRSTWQIKRLSP